MQNVINYREYFNIELIVPVAKLNHTTVAQDNFGLYAAGFFPISRLKKHQDPDFYEFLLLSIPEQFRPKVKYFILCVEYTKTFLA